MLTRASIVSTSYNDYRVNIDEKHIDSVASLIL